MAPKMSIEWLGLSGKVAGNNNSLEYIGEKPPGTQSDATGQIRSSISFQNGKVSFEVQFSEAKQRVHLMLNDLSARTLAIGPNWGGATYGAGIWNNNHWEPLAIVGQGNPIPPQKWVKCVVEVLGSNISLYADEVLAFTINQTTTSSPLSFWFNGVGKISVRNIKIESHAAEAFVVMQFGDAYDAIYRDVIKPVLSEYGYKVIRADEMTYSGLIIEQINATLRNSAIIVADITPDNPNVYYEVGYAHALNKPTILLCDKQRGKLPFDLSGFRAIFYENSIRGKPVVEEQLRRHLESL